MSKTFTASNGIAIDTTPMGSVRLDTSEAFPFELTIKGTEALREFFQHERDEELGRWRHKTCLVYPLTEGRIEIQDERTKKNMTITREIAEIRSKLEAPSVLVSAANAYFAAHPESKPWHEANHNEIWALRFENGENYFPFRWDAGESAWFDSNANMALHRSDERKIVAARRIWPEHSDG